VPKAKLILLLLGIWMVSIGDQHSTAQEFCGKSLDGIDCNLWTVMGQSIQDPDVNQQSLVMVNGALSSQTADSWGAPTELHYDRVRDTILVPLGLGEPQVQVANTHDRTGWCGSRPILRPTGHIRRGRASTRSGPCCCSSLRLLITPRVGSSPTQPVRALT
jgi:hypothetical protein